MAAIYGFRESFTIELTTTLYPVEVVESIEFGVGFTAGTMLEVPGSEMAFTIDATSCSYTQLRWYYSDGPYDSDMAFTFNAERTSYTQLRWFYSDGPYDSNMQFTFAAIRCSLVNKLVEADSPDESLQLEIAFDATSTMDAI